MLKNRCTPALSEANCHARLSRSKQWLKNTCPVMLASFGSQMKRNQWPHRKNPLN